MCRERKKIWKKDTQRNKPKDCRISGGLRSHNAGSSFPEGWPCTESVGYLPQTQLVVPVSLLFNKEDTETGRD